MYDTFYHSHCERASPLCLMSYSKFFCFDDEGVLRVLMRVMGLLFNKAD